MLHALDVGEHAHDRVVHLHSPAVATHQSVIFCHLYVAAEADDLVADGMFEAKHHTHAHNHHGKSYRHPDSGNADGRTRHLALVVVLGIYAMC